MKREFILAKWKVSKNRDATINYMPQKQVGGSMSRNQNKGVVVFIRKEKTHKCISMKYNTLLIAIKFAMQIFTKERSVKTMHLQTDNATALADFVKIGITYNLELLPVAKETLNVFQTNKGNS